MLECAYLQALIVTLSRCHCHELRAPAKKAGISAENRGNWRAEIWNRTKNVVPLHCQNEGEKWRAS